MIYLPANDEHGTGAATYVRSRSNDGHSEELYPRLDEVTPLTTPAKWLLTRYAVALCSACTGASEEKTSIKGAQVEPSGFLTVEPTASAAYPPNANEAGAGRGPISSLAGAGEAWDSVDLREWHERLSRSGVPLLPYEPTRKEIPVAVDRQAFAQVIDRSGISLPDDLPLSFRRSYDLPAVDPRLNGKIRAVPQAIARAGNRVGPFAIRRISQGRVRVDAACAAYPQIVLSDARAAVE